MLMESCALTVMRCEHLLKLHTCLHIPSQICSGVQLHAVEVYLPELLTVGGHQVRLLLLTADHAHCTSHRSRVSVPLLCCSRV